MPQPADRRTHDPTELQLTPLRSFVVLSQLKSYTRAAEELGYSEPGVYLQIKNLEKLLGVPLVKRHGKEVLLTTAGTRLVGPASDVLSGARLVFQIARGLQNRIAVASGANTAVSLLMPLIARFQQEYPDHRVELSALSTEAMARGVIDGTFDIAVGGFEQKGPRLEIEDHKDLLLRPWRRDDWSVFGPARTQRLLRNATAMSSVPLFFMHAKNWPHPEKVESLVATKLNCPVELVELDTLELVRGAIVNGLGLGVMPGSAEALYGGEGLVRMSELGDEGKLVIRLLHRRPRNLAQPVRDFLAFIIKERHGALSI